MPSICSSRPQTGLPTSEDKGILTRTSQHPRAVLGRKPCGEKERHPLEEPGFRDSEQQAQAVKLFGPTTKAVAADTMPQLIMMRASQRRAPKR